MALTLITRHRPALIAMVLTATLIAAALIARAFGAFVPLELMAYDMGMRFQAGAAIDQRIVLVSRTEEDLRLHGYPTSDETLAQLLEKLVSMKAAVIGVDIYRSSSVPPGAEQLDVLLRQNRNLVWIMKFTDRDGHSVPAPVALQDKEEQIGFNDLLDDPGGIIRRGILVLDNGETSAFSFALQIAAAYLKPSGKHLQPDPGNPDVLRLGETSILPFEKSDGGYIDADAAGYQFLLDFKGGRAHFPSYSFDEVLRGVSSGTEKSPFAGKIVIVGTAAKSLNDYFYTPLSIAMDEGDQRMLGAELHGHIVSQLLRHAGGESRPLATFSDTLEAAWIAAMGLLGAVIGFVSRRLSHFVFALLVATVNIVGMSYVLFAYAIWLPVAAPLIVCIMCITTASAFATQNEKEQRNLVMHFFSQHVSKDIADEIWRRRDDFLENNRPRPIPLTATVLFTDLEGFTSISENLAPDELFGWLNEYMQAMSEVVIEHNGVINKYIGDAIMGIFGVPFARTTDAEIATDARNAVACALAMERTLIPLNAKWVAEGKKPIRMRVGIYTGPLVAGCLGGSDRLEYTVIGDTVNTASRLESAGKSITLPQAKTRSCCITIGESTQRLLADNVRLTPIGSVELKGKEQKIQTFYVEAEAPEETS